MNNLDSLVAVLVQKTRDHDTAMRLKSEATNVENMAFRAVNDAKNAVEMEIARLVKEGTSKP